VNKELQKGSTVTLILSLLNQRAMYGYEMIRQIEEHSHGVFTLKEGTLYPILHGLESDGSVKSYWDDSAGNRKRKYYAITKFGQSQLQSQRREWTLFKTAVDRVIGEGNS
jgi:PadR family transcriptional regulator PadR